MILTIVTALEVGIGTTIGNGHFWGYYPGHWWGKLILKLFLIPVKVEGREHLEKGQSYVFVANHQGAFDIFLIYGHLNRNFKWMMKQALRKIPFVGYACEKSHQIFVDKRGPSKIRKTYEDAREILKDHQRQFRHPASHEGLQLHQLASDDADHPSGHLPDRSRSRECRCHLATGIRLCDVVAQPEVSRIC